MVTFKHIVFYDGACGLCDHTVQFLLNIDKKGEFGFAPLQGSTALSMLKDLPDNQKQADSLILIENYLQHDQKIYIRSKAIFRIFWLLGGMWSMIGSLFFLPAFLFDWGYNLVAKNRHRFFNDTCTLPDKTKQDRFLP